MGAAVRSREVVAEEVVASEAAVALPSLRVEDPELRPPPRRAESVAGDGHLRPLADDVAPEPDPRSAGELEAEARRFGDGGGEAGRQARWLEGDEERLRAAGQRGEPAEAIGDVGGGRAGIRARRQVDDEEVDRPAGEERAGDRQALVEGLGGQDDEPVEAHAAGDGLDRVEAPGEIEPGDDRAVDLGLCREPEGEGRLAGARLAAEGDARAARQAARTEDRIERREAGPDDPLRAAAAGRFAGKERSGAPAPRPGAAPSPAPRRPAELPLPSVPGGTPEQPTRPGRAPPSAYYRTDVLVDQWLCLARYGRPANLPISILAEW